MLFSLPGPNTETELAREDPGEVVEEAGRDPAGRGKQAAGNFYPAQTSQPSCSKSAEAGVPIWPRRRPRSPRPSGGSHQGLWKL